MRREGRKETVKHGSKKKREQELKREPTTTTTTTTKPLFRHDEGKKAT